MTGRAPARLARDRRRVHRRSGRRLTCCCYNRTVATCSNSADGQDSNCTRSPQWVRWRRWSCRMQDRRRRDSVPALGGQFVLNFIGQWLIRCWREPLMTGQLGPLGSGPSRSSTERPGRPRVLLLQPNRSYLLQLRCWRLGLELVLGARSESGDWRWSMRTWPSGVTVSQLGRPVCAEFRIGQWLIRCWREPPMTGQLGPLGSGPSACSSTDGRDAHGCCCYNRTVATCSNSVDG